MDANTIMYCTGVKATVLEQVIDQFNGDTAQALASIVQTLPTLTKEQISRSFDDVGAINLPANQDVINAMLHRTYHPRLDTIRPEPSLLVSPELRDPLTKVLSFVPYPTHLCMTCHFLVEVFNHAVYLETPLGCPYFTALDRSSAASLLAVSKEAAATTSAAAVSSGLGVVADGTCPIPVLLNKIPDLSSTYLLHLAVKLHIADYPYIHFIGPGIGGSPLITIPVESGDRTQQRTESGFVGDLGDAVTLLRLTRLPNLTRIRNDFMNLEHVHKRGAPSKSTLRTTIFTDLPRLSVIGDRVLRRSRVARVKVDRLPELTTIIGDEFLFDCPNLRQFSFTNLPSLLNIGSGWLSKTSLVSVTIAQLPQLSQIGADCLRMCSSLEEATFADLPALTSIGAAWLSQTALKRLDLRTLPKLGHIGPLFASDSWGSVSEFSFSGLQRIQRVHWFNNSGIVKVVMADLPELGDIGDDFLSECDNLRSATFKNLPQLTSVGRRWLYRCAELKEACFSNLPVLQEVQCDWMGKCESMEQIHLIQLPSLSRIGPSFLNKTPTMVAGVRPEITDDQSGAACPKDEDPEMRVNVVGCPSAESRLWGVARGNFQEFTE